MPPPTPADYAARIKGILQSVQLLPDEAKAPILARVSEAKAAFEVMEPRVARILPPPAPEQLSLLALALGEPDARLDWHGLPVRRAAS